MGRKTLGVKEKLLVTSNFSFSLSVFKGPVLQTRKSQGLFGKELNIFICNNKLQMDLQVLDWLDNHGDVFLKKNTSIGRSLSRSRALQKSHEHFESVAKVTEFFIL